MSSEEHSWEVSDWESALGISSDDLNDEISGIDESKALTAGTKVTWQIRHEWIGLLRPSITPLDGRGDWRIECRWIVHGCRKSFTPFKVYRNITMIKYLVTIFVCRKGTVVQKQSVIQSIEKLIHEFEYETTSRVLPDLMVIIHVQMIS